MKDSSDGLLLAFDRPMVSADVIVKTKLLLLQNLKQAEEILLKKMCLEF